MEIIEGQLNDPHTGIWLDIARDPDCLVCGERLRQGVSLLAEEDEGSISLADLAASGLTTEIEFEDEDD